MPVSRARTCMIPADSHVTSVTHTLARCAYDGSRPLRNNPTHTLPYHLDVLHPACSLRACMVSHSQTCPYSADVLGPPLSTRTVLCARQDETGATGGRMPPGLRVSSEADIPAPNPHHLPHNHLYPLHHNDHNRTNGHNGVTPAAARAIAAFGPGAPPGYASNSMIIRPQHGSSGLDPAVSPTASGGAGSLAATPVGASAPVRMALPERLSSGAVAAAAAAGGGGGNGFGGSASVETSNGKLVAAAAAAPAAAAAAAASTSPGRAGPGVARKMTADELLVGGRVVGVPPQGAGITPLSTCHNVRPRCSSACVTSCFSPGLRNAWHLAR